MGNSSQRARNRTILGGRALWRFWKVEPASVILNTMTTRPAARPKADPDAGAYQTLLSALETGDPRGLANLRKMFELGPEAIARVMRKHPASYDQVLIASHRSAPICTFSISSRVSWSPDRS